MSIEEAKKELEKGNKITHIYFLPEEYVYFKDGFVHDENDVNIGTVEQFFQIRYEPGFLSGWIIYNN